MTSANFLVPFNADDIKAVHNGTADIRTMIATMTSQTCGEACWHAKEEHCRCSCGGANHGCLLKHGAEQPVRTKKIDGAMYELAGVDVKPHEVDSQLSSGEFEPACVTKNYKYYPDDIPYDKPHWFTYQSRNSPLRAKTASKDEIARWPELAAYRNRDAWLGSVYLLWKLKRTAAQLAQAA